MAGVPMGAVQQVKQVHTMAYVAIGCAIASWFVIPFLGAVVAIIAGTMARKEIKANPDKWTGDDYAKWGVIIGGVHIALWVVGIIGSLGMMLFCGGLSMLTH
jgi:flavin-dependent dehydrogenase